MDTFRVVSHVVPKVDTVVRVRQVVLKIALLDVNKVWELGWVTKEEDGRVVVYPIHVAVLGAELDRESTRITRAIRRARFASDCGESHGDRAFSLLGKKLGKAEVRDGVGGTVDSVSTAALCMNDALWDALAVEVREHIDQVKVLKQERSLTTGTLGFIGMGTATPLEVV